MMKNRRNRTQRARTKGQKQLKINGARRILSGLCLGAALVWATGLHAQTMTNLIPEAGTSSQSQQAVSEDAMIDQNVQAIVNQQQQRAASGAQQGVVDPGNFASQYTLGPVDVIDVLVMRHPEVSGQYVVNQEGKIQYEFVGDIYVAGKTKDEVAQLLTDTLSEFIISPAVTVKIVGYNSKVVYVVGEVARPGKVFMRGDTITVREALVQAGLPLLSAKAAKSKLITPSMDKETNVRNVNVQKLLYQGDLNENLVMEPGDTLYVPATLMAKTMRILQPVSQPIGTAASTGRTLTTGF